MRLNSFHKRVVTLLSGTIVAQGMTIVVAPFLTRLYTPDDFGIFGTFMAASAITSVLVTLRLEKSIIIPAESDESFRLLKLVVIIAGSMSVMVSTLLYCFGDLIALSFGIVRFYGDWVLIPVAAFAIAGMQGFNAWLIYIQKFRDVSLSKIGQSVSTVVPQIVAGLSNLGAKGLILGQLVGFVAGIGMAGKFGMAGQHGKLFAPMHWRELLTKYSRFPIYALPADLLNITTGYLPLFILGYFFGPTKVGLYLITQRVVAAPAALVGNAILDVFKERAAAEYREFGNCRAAYLSTLKSLALLGIVPTISLLLFAPELFATFFGAEWRESGTMTQLLTPMLYLGFVASPLSYVFYIAQRQSADLFWQIGLFFILSGSLLLGGLHGSAEFAVFLFSVGYSLMYIVYILLSYQFSLGIEYSSGRRK